MSCCYRACLVVIVTLMLVSFSAAAVHSQGEAEQGGSAGGIELEDGMVRPEDGVGAKAVTCAPCPTVPALLTPVQDICSVVQQNNPNIGCAPHPHRGYGLRINFNWTDATSPQGIAGYFIFVKNVNAPLPLIDRFVPVSQLAYRSCNAFVPDPLLLGWQWRVRAQDRQGGLGPWSPFATFAFEPCRLAGGSPCSAP